MSKDKPHDMKAGGKKGLYHCRVCDPKCEKGYALPGKCSKCGKPLTNKPPVTALTNKPPVTALTNKPPVTTLTNKPPVEP